MAGNSGTKISDLPLLTEFHDNTFFPVVDSGVNKKATIDQLKSVIPAGKDGETGADGASAYEVAVKNGFEGTEQQWLDSLKGAEGARGEPGKSVTDEQIIDATATWLAEHITNPTNPPIDTSLSISGAAADAAATGEIKSILFATEIFSVNDWEQGSINASTGGNANNSSRIRTKGYLPWGVQKLRSTNSNVRFLVYAYDSSDTYIGGWWNDGTFNSTDVKAVASVDFATILRNPAYRNYKFRACIYITGGTASIETISDVYIDALSLLDYLKDKPTMNLDRVPIIPNGTDFDTLTAAGEWLVENYSQISTHTNTPPGVAAGGRLWVLSGISNSRVVQVWLSFDSNREPQLWIRQNLGASVWQKWCQITSGAMQPVNLRVLGYNIGKFNYGYDHGTSHVEDISVKIANYKKIFGKVNPDIMLFAELTSYIDASDTINTNTALIQPLFWKIVNFHENAAMTNITSAKTIEGDGGLYLRNNNNEYAGAVGRLVCDIGNRKLVMSGGFLRVLSTAQDRLEAFQNYLAAIAGYDYSIIYLDTNVQDNAEREALYNAAVSAGYTVCNGGYFGLTDTLVPTKMYKPIDNIFVKGNIKVKNFEVLTDEYGNLSSDHIPIVADLTLY